MGIERLIELEENQCTVSRIIAGEVFMLEKEEADLDAAEAFDIAITTPATRKYCVYAEYEAMGGSVQITLYEGATLTAETGTALTTVNLNGNSEKTYGATVLFNPTVTATGTALRSRKIRSAANVPARQASSIGETLPRMLKPSTTYLIRCVASTDGVDFGAYLRLGQK